MMTTQQVMELAKEKLGRDITEQEAQDYLNGKMAIPDEALDLVSGGASCGTCSVCGQPISRGSLGFPYCNNPYCSEYLAGLTPGLK